MLLFTSSLAICHALLMGQGPGAEVRNSCTVVYCHADSNCLMTYYSPHAHPVGASCGGGVLVSKVKGFSE